MQRIARGVIAFGLGLSLGLSPAFAEGDKPAEKKGPPFADKKKPEQATKPETRSWNVIQDGEKGKMAFGFLMKPGIPDPNQLTEVVVTANLLPTRPDPVYGSQVPLEGARLVVEVTNPAGELVGRYLAHPMPLAKGRFGIHVTPTQEGIYTLSLKGKTAKGDAVSADVKLPVKVWPLPPELEGSGQEGGASARRAPIKL